MKDEERWIHPYIPNSAPETRAEMLRDTGAASPDEFYEDIPRALRVPGLLNLPRARSSEYSLKRHVEEILSKNRTAAECLSFLGAGCWQHHVPAVCDEVNQRSEFLTAYAGEPYDDHGRFQALFEYASLMGELLEMDVVNVPTYDGFQATATALRMASRITGRNEVLVARSVSKSRLSKLRDYLKPDLEIGLVDFDRLSGHLNLADLANALSPKTAAVYFENPSYLGCIDTAGDKTSQMAHAAGALSVVGVNPISLGVIAPPASYGADIVCGDIQPLGMHMQFGGGQAGFIATRDEERFVREFPSRLFGITSTRVPGEYGFGDVAYERTSFALREKGKEWVGTAAALWGITAGVYLALMGPRGMVEIGESIMTRARYAMLQLSRIEGVQAPVFHSPHFGEFVVNFDETNRTVGEINRSLLAHGIFGGKDLSKEFPELGECALYSVTEVHGQRDLNRLASTLQEILS
jgi:glycine dehydrogenase subunit 1